jgi:hypothetical protein
LDLGSFPGTAGGWPGTSGAAGFRAKILHRRQLRAKIPHRRRLRAKIPHRRASKRDSASPAALSEDSAPQFGRRVIYLLDWFAPHLDASVDALINGAGHAVLRVGGHLTGLVQVEDTHAHGPMTKIYKKQESLEAYEQLTLRPDKLPSTTRQTVLDRALGSWRAVDHAACSRGFVSNGIANKLDGSEDETLTWRSRSIGPS